VSDTRTSMHSHQHYDGERAECERQSTPLPDLVEDLMNRIAVTVLICAVVTVGLMGRDEPMAAQQPNAVTAIDILLDPDATMLARAQEDNARLRKNFPGGFALDETHQPHITALQRYVRTADLEKCSRR